MGCLNHTWLDGILEDKNVNLSYLQSLANFQFWTFGLYHLNIWIQFVQTFGTSCIYTTYLDNSIVSAGCFSPLVLTLILQYFVSGIYDQYNNICASSILSCTPRLVKQLQQVV